MTTKNEVLTMILEEGKKAFEKGGAIFINSMLISNFDKASELSFDYESGTKMIKAVYVYSSGDLILCVCVEAIESISVTKEWSMLPGIGDTMFGYVNGERFSCNRR